MRLGQDQWTSRLADGAISYFIRTLDFFNLQVRFNHLKHNVALLIFVVNMYFQSLLKYPQLVSIYLFKYFSLINYIYLKTFTRLIVGYILTKKFIHQVLCVADVSRTTSILPSCINLRFGISLTIDFHVVNKLLFHLIWVFCL